MAAPFITFDGYNVTEANSTTGFGEPAGATAGGVPVLETDYFIQGTNCISKTFNSTSVGGLAVTFSLGGGVTPLLDYAVYVWCYFAAPNATATKVNGGLRVYTGVTTSSYKQYYVGGSDTYTYGGWVSFPVDLSIAGSVNVGAPSPTANYTIFGFTCNVVNAIGKGNPLGLDAINYARGLSVWFGDVVNGYGTFTSLANMNDNVLNRYGIFSFVDGSYKMQGRILMGTNSSPVDFRDTNKAIVIQNTEFVSANFNLFEVQNTGSHVEWTGVSVSTLGTVSKGRFLVTDNATVILTSCSFVGMDTFTFQAATTVSDTTFRRCGLITHGNAAFTANVVANSTATSALITATPATIQDCSFVSAGTGHAITITAPGTYTFSGNQFTGYGTAGTTNAAVYNNSGGLVTLNIAGGGTVPTIRNGTGASTNVVASSLLTLTGLKANSEIRAYTGTDPVTAVEIGGVEDSTTSFAFSHSVGGASGYIQILHVDYQPIYLPLVYAGADATIPVQQITDRQYQRGSINTPG